MVEITYMRPFRYSVYRFPEFCVSDTSHSTSIAEYKRLRNTPRTREGQGTGRKGRKEQGGRGREGRRKEEGMKG